MGEAPDDIREEIEETRLRMGEEDETMPEAPGPQAAPEPQEDQPSAAEQAEDEQRKQEESGQENAA